MTARSRSEEFRPDPATLRWVAMRLREWDGYGVRFIVGRIVAWLFLEADEVEAA